MPLDQIVPPPVIVPAFQWEWPPPLLMTGGGGGGAFVATGLLNNGSPAEASLWGASAGAGTNNMLEHNSIVAGRWGGAAAVSRPVDRAQIRTKLTSANIAPNAILPEALRVMYMGFWFAVSANPTSTILNRLTGWQFRGAGSTVGTQPTFGIVGDGVATGFHWASYDITVTQLESIFIPASVVPDWTAWNYAEFEFINSSFNRDASVTLRINGQVFVTRSWAGPLPNLPVYGTVGSQSWAFVCDNANFSTFDLFLGPMFMRFSKYTRAGVEIRS